MKQCRGGSPPFSMRGRERKNRYQFWVPYLTVESTPRYYHPRPRAGTEGMSASAAAACEPSWSAGDVLSP